MAKKPKTKPIEPHELAAKFSDEQMSRFVDLLLAHGEPTPAPKVPEPAKPKAKS